MPLNHEAGHKSANNGFRSVRDFLVIVLAILAGLCVYNLYTAHKSHVRSKEIRAHLFDELKQEAWIHHYITAYHQDVLRHAELARKGLLGKSAQPDETLLINLYRASQFTWWNRRRATFDTLVANGELNLIRDNDVRAVTLAIYTSPLRAVVEDRGRYSPYRQAFRRAVPSDIHRALGEACGDKSIEIGDYAGFDDIFGYDCALDLSPEKIQDAVLALRADPDILPTLRLRIATLETQLADLEESNAVSAFFEELKEE